MLTFKQIAQLKYRQEVHDAQHNNWRVNGQFKYNKKTGDFRLPIKHGLYDYGAITDNNKTFFHFSHGTKIKISKRGTKTKVKVGMRMFEV